jgi:hypothetical protein
MDCVILLLPEGWKRELRCSRRLSLILVQAVAEEEELLLAATRLSSFAPDSSLGCYLKECFVLDLHHHLRKIHQGSQVAAGVVVLFPWPLQVPLAVQQVWLPSPLRPFLPPFCELSLPVS